MANKYTELKRQAEVLLSQMTCGKNFIIGHVSDRLEKTAEENPQDHVVRAMAHVIGRMSHKDPSKIISQAELENIYQRLVGLNPKTKFREIFSDLLLTKDPKKVVNANEKFIQNNRDPLTEAINEINPEMRDPLNRMFEENIKTYDTNKINFAKEKASIEFKSLGFKPRLKLAGGDSDFFIFSADFHTPKGVVTAHVPVDASGEYFPSIIIANNQFKTLTKSVLSDFVQHGERNTAPPNVPAVLASLQSLIGNINKTASQKQLQEDLSKFSDGKDISLFSPTVLASMPGVNEIQDIEIPRTEVPKPLKVIAEDVEDQIVESALDYPLTSVRLAKRMLHAELTAMGFKNNQIRISSSTDDGLICEAILNTAKGKISIEVPIEMKNNQPLMPSVFAHKDFVDDFSQEKISSFLLQGPEPSLTSIQRNSQIMACDIMQLKSIIAEAVAKNDLKTCDEVLEIIANRFSLEEYRETIKSYKSMLKTAGSAKKAYGESKCSRVIKSANSIYPICGHLMIPLHKVVQDESGICHRASTYHSRQVQDEEGAIFSTAKILLND